jgi:putative PIN family toxin of toxin-antitoxin system
MTSALFDTNVLYSALLYPKGAAGLLLRLAIAGQFELWVSASVLDELEAILSRPKAKKELGRSASRAEVEELLEAFAGAFYNIGECPTSDVVPGDPRDNHIVSAAVYAQVDYLVSGDKKHVLPLKSHPGLRALGLNVVTISEFIEILASDVKP